MRPGALGLLILLAGCARDLDGDNVSAGQDCDDTDATVFPGAPEVCDGADNDCDGLTDEEPVDGQTFYADADGDGYAGDRLVVVACTAPAEAWDTTATDCDDLSPAAHPGAAEVCDGADNDCDGLADDADADVDPDSFIDLYRDSDGDGFGDDAKVTRACAPDALYVAVGGDCDDTDPEQYPGRDWHADRDGDGFGDAAEAFLSCAPPEGFIADRGDCDDQDPLIHPSAAEVCDGVDNDCDGDTDDADADVDPDSFRDLYRDDDGDGFGDDARVTRACAPDPLYVAVGGDCDDTSAATSPAAAEVCNDGIDNNCDETAWPCGFSGDNYPADAGLLISSSGGNLAYEVGVADLDGDGQDDVVVPAYATGGGEVYVLYGPLSADVDLPTEADARLAGASAFDYAGKSLSTGDADGDGYADLLLGAYGVDAYGNLAVAAYLVYGGAPLSGALSLSSSADQVWYGSEAAVALGTVVRFVGDLDDDGYAELALGGSGYDSGDGAVLLIYGGSSEGSTHTDAAADARLEAAFAADLLGESGGVAGGGDLDGDGYSELVVRAALSDLGGTDAGAVSLFYGGARLDGTVSLGDASATFVAGSDYAELGAALLVGGDWNSDGYADLVIGVTAADPILRNEGTAYVLLGGRSRYATTAKAATLAAAAITGAAASDYAGAGLASAGDFDADGYDDLLVGASGVDDAGQSAVGAAYLLCGPLSGVRAVSSAEATLLGDASYAYVGRALAAGDVSGDGMGDLLISGHGEDQLLVFFGGAL